MVGGLAGSPPFVPWPTGRSGGPFPVGNKSGAGSAAWTPSSLGSSLKGWWRSDLGVKGRTAAQFTAANSESLDRADEAAFRGGAAFSWAGFVLFDVALGNNAPLSKYVSGTDWEFVFRTEADAKLAAYIGSGTSNNGKGTTVLSAATWYHVAIVYNGAGAGNSTRLLIYVNGVAETLSFSGTIPATITANAGAWRMGGYNSNFVGGRIANASWWNRALVQADVDALYNAGAGTRYADFTGSQTSLVSWWELDEESGTRADKVGGKTLTDTNTVTSNDGKVEYAVTADASVVYKWTDQSAGALLPVQATHANKPILKTAVINNQNVLRFDGSNDFLKVATGAISNQPLWGWAVVDDNDAATRYYLDGGAASKVSLFHDGTNLNANAGSSVGAAHSAGAPHLVTFSVNGASSQVWVDGTSLATGDAGAQNQDSGIAIGADNAGATPLQGDIAEIAFVAGSPSVADLANLRAYIVARYGLTVA